MDNHTDPQEEGSPPSSSSPPSKPLPPWVAFLLHPARGPLLRSIEVAEDLQAGVGRLVAPLRRALEGLDQIARELADLDAGSFARLQGAIPKEGITGDPR